MVTQIPGIWVVYQISTQILIKYLVICYTIIPNDQVNEILVFARMTFSIYIP